MYTIEEVGDTFDVGYRCGQLDGRRRDDLLDIADAAGVTPMDGVGDADLIDEVERWLREQ